MSIIKPGGGFLTTDGRSIVPLQVVLQKSKEPHRIIGAKIIAARGEVTSLRVLDETRVQFLYKAPKSETAIKEFFDVAMSLDGQRSLIEGFVIELSPSAAPLLEFQANPQMVDVREVSTVELSAVARGAKLTGLTLFADHGRLGERPAARETDKWTQAATWNLPVLPVDAPSYLTALAVATQETGFASELTGLSVSAPVRLSVDIPFPSRLEIEGARSSPPPVSAPREGKTVMDDVIVNYAEPLSAYRVDPSGRQPVSLVLPTGVVAPGVIAPIPGQAVADGGTGPTVVVAIPPGPFGTPPFWPDLTVEGAAIVEVVRLSERSLALVLRRPFTPADVRILLDGVPLGEISLAGGHGQRLSVDETAAVGEERAAAYIEVKDAAGSATDAPVPEARGPSGELLPLERESVGTYRTFLPSSMLGKAGSTAQITVQLPPPPRIAGPAVEPILETVSVTLRDRPLSTSKAHPSIQEPIVPKQPSSPTRFSLAGAASLGTTFGSFLALGGFVQCELRFPFWDARTGFRLGGEFALLSASGETTFGENRQLPSETRITNIAIPLEAVVTLIRLGSFDLTLHGGGAVRFDQGALEIASDSAGGGNSIQLTGRGGIEASVDLGAGALFFGATVSGLGGELDGLSSDGLQFVGSLAQIRGELGYRFSVFP